MPFLWLISQTINNDWDTYDSAVVCAATAEDAKRIHPGGGESGSFHKTWADPEHVTVEQIGIPVTGVQEGAVICASFNAG